MYFFLLFLVVLCTISFALALYLFLLHNQHSHILRKNKYFINTFRIAYLKHFSDKMNIQTILIMILYTGMRVISLNWTPKTGNNAIVLVQHSSALISFKTHTQKYEFNLAGLFDITDTIRKHINTLEINCLELNDVFCKEKVDKLNTHLMSLNEKITSISNLERNCINLRTKKDLNLKEALKKF
jgi:hypothetical protein